MTTWTAPCAFSGNASGRADASPTPDWAPDDVVEEGGGGPLPTVRSGGRQHRRREFDARDQFSDQGSDACVEVGDDATYGRFVLAAGVGDGPVAVDHARYVRA